MRRGFTLLEVTVAVALLAVGVVALERLLARSVAVIATDARIDRAMLLGRTLLAEAALAPPEPGVSTGERPEGLSFQREVARTPHPELREVRVLVRGADGTILCELVELVRVPPA